MDNVLIQKINIEEFKSLIASIVEETLEKKLFSTTTPEKEILNVEEAADFLGIAKSSVYRKVSNREVPHFKKGSKLYFSKPDLIEWIGEGKQRTVTEITNKVFGKAS